MFVIASDESGREQVTNKSASPTLVLLRRSVVAQLSPAVSFTTLMMKTASNEIHAFTNYSNFIKFFSKLSDMFVTATAQVISSEHAFHTENSDVREGFVGPN